ncbi:hypothetical protein M427DRAFT_69774 [Gonapodya prolifera JEL478]|uniref:Uncharacterized protein n=1 Tax=Gonapodya prolifera (strain JEL478) TaxID=1344416 RepID=A0A139AGF8_GONPJ|nr:hypothetical protein M427DRAFT_69774 [Gonapodya prolifera JEL478]|eukprot:KXS15886.1 hypothetical protein M427DRAFT_69774 [Gonapodya prolifera JEL478]
MSLNSDFLFPHLKKEEDLIFSDGEIKLKFTPDEMRELKKKLDAQLQAEDPLTSLPFFVYLTPETREWMLFEDMPWIVKGGLAAVRVLVEVQGCVYVCA